MIFIGAMPYFMSNHGYSFVDCIFESASGWTTTGSTVIKTPLTQSLLLWKTVTGWLGGMIVIIFTTALLPYLGIGAQKLAITEIPGPDLEKMAPKFGDIAKITGGIYILLTVGPSYLRQGRADGTPLSGGIAALGQRRTTTDRRQAS